MTRFAALQNYVSALDALDYNLQPLGMYFIIIHLFVLQFNRLWMGLTTICNLLVCTEKRVLLLIINYCLLLVLFVLFVLLFIIYYSLFIISITTVMSLKE